MEFWCSADPTLQDCRCLSLELSHIPYGMEWASEIKQFALFHGSVVSVSSVLVGISECQFHPCFCKKIPSGSSSEKQDLSLVGECGQVKESLQLLG